MSEGAGKNPLNKRAAAILAAVALAAPMTAGFEGYVPKTYLDPVKIPTACYGHTGKDVKLGQTYTKEECDGLLKKDLEIAGKGVDQCVHVPITLNQRAAYTDFTLNGGTGLFCKSSMARKTNEGDAKGGCAALSLYVYAKGKPLPGLVKRRAAERALCEKGLD